MRVSSYPQSPRVHPPGAPLPGRLHPRPSWKWQADGRGQGHERDRTRRGEPSGGAHRWEPLPQRLGGRRRRGVAPTGPPAGGFCGLTASGPELAASLPSLSLLICKTGFSGSCPLLRTVPGAGPLKIPKPRLHPRPINPDVRYSFGSCVMCTVWKPLA